MKIQIRCRGTPCAGCPSLLSIKGAATTQRRVPTTFKTTQYTTQDALLFFLWLQLLKKRTQ